MNMLEKNRGFDWFDLNVICKQVGTQRMSYEYIKKCLYAKNEQNRP